MLNCRIRYKCYCNNCYNSTHKKTGNKTDKTIVNTIVLSSAHSLTDETTTMKLLRKLFGAKNKIEPIKAAPKVVAEVKPPKPVISLDVVEQTSDEQELLKLASDGATSPLRQAAAEKIHSRELLEQLAKTAKSKDKTLFKIVKTKLDAFKAVDAKLAEIEASAVRICEKLERHIHQEADALFKAKLTVLQTEWAALTQTSAASAARYETALTACENKIAARAQLIADEEEKITLDQQAMQLAQEAYSSLKSLAQDIYRAAHIDDLVNANYEVKIQELSNAVRLAANRQLPLDKLTKEFEQRKQQTLNLIDQIKTSGTAQQIAGMLQQAEDSDVIKSAQYKLQQFVKSAKELGEELPESLHEAKAKLDAIWAERYQAEQAAKNALRDFSELARKGLWAAEQGFVRKARAIQKELAEKRVQLSATMQELPKGIQAKIDDFEAQLAKLGDWHEFAVTPKKEALINQMQTLATSAIDPEILATKVHELQDSWKEVSKGAQQQDDQLWQQFQQASAIAYAPCKEFFETQSAAREENLNKRRELVAQLTAYLNDYDFTNAAWKEVEQTLKTARAEWQTYWPVPRKAGNELQKEFETLMEQLFGKITNEYENNKIAKQQLIDQAQALLDNTDMRAATEAVKQLQAHWKTIGKSWHKEDQQLWQEFRKHCDAIFSRRNEAFEAAKAARDAVVQEAESLIAQLHEFAKRSMEELKAAKTEIDAIQATFSALELPKEAAKSLQQKLATSLTAIANKRDSARAQAEKQSWKDLFSALDALREYELAVIAHEPAETLTAQKAALEEMIANTPRWPSGCLNGLQHRLAKADAITVAEQEANTQALRTLTIRAEIITGLESPASDKQARMVYQVQQMQQGFGQRDTNLEPLLTEWIALAGVDTAEYAPLLQRFNSCRAQGDTK
jgi:exonuclease SbcC